MFEQDEPWKKLCLDCWKESKGLGGGRAPMRTRADVLQDQLDQVREELFTARHRIQQLSGEVSRLRARPTSPGIDAAMLGKLIRLCHPDKHGGGEVATQVTQWLLSQRK